MPTCEQCRHFRVFLRSARPPGDQLLGECRRFPPTVPPTVINVGCESTPLAAFPILRAGEWGGEFSEATSRAVVSSSPFTRQPAPTAADDRRLLVSAREASKMLGVSERLLWGMTKKGDIQRIRVGKRVCYNPDVLRAWIAAQGR